MKDCFSPPGASVAAAARNLLRAVFAHRAGNRSEALACFQAADDQALYERADKAWGKKPPAERPKRGPHPPVGRAIDPQEPAPALKAFVIARDGYCCQYCGAPVIRKEIRNAIRRAFPELRWGARGIERHFALQALWLCYEHVEPHSRGGRTSPGNLVIAFWPCNGGKMEYTLGECGLNDPRRRRVVPLVPEWDGLEGFVKGSTPGQQEPGSTHHQIDVGRREEGDARR